MGLTLSEIKSIAREIVFHFDETGRVIGKKRRK